MSNWSIPDEEPAHTVSLQTLQFSKFHSGTRTPRAIAKGVFDKMREKPTKSDGRGYIYILQNPRHVEFVKIGCTSKGPEERQQEWMKCGYELELLDYDNECFLPVDYHRRIEKLIQRDLWNERHCFPCVCGRKHDEWFKIGKEQARRIVEGWKDWMRSLPYENGLLTKIWEAKVKFCENDKKDFIKRLEEEDKEGRRWESFWKLEVETPLSRIRSWMFKKRLGSDGRLYPSRFTTVRARWREHMISCIGLFVAFVAVQHYGPLPWWLCGSLSIAIITFTHII